MLLSHRTVTALTFYFLTVVFAVEFKKHVQNSVYPYDVDPPCYNIDSWTRQLHLQQCAFVEIGDKYYALFVETRPRFYDEDKGIREYFLGLCDEDTLRQWPLCQPNLHKKRSEDCTFPLENTVGARVHRRLCDITHLSMNAPQCNCNYELSDTRLYRVTGFPTCFKPPLPESLCGDNNVCGLSACMPVTINKRVYTAVCDKKCISQQPFCEEPTHKSSQPRRIRSFWTDWTNPFCTDVTCISQFDQATCINSETGKGDIDCLGPGTSCCTSDMQNCKCHVYEENGVAKVFRTFTVPQPEITEFMSEEDFINSIPLRYLEKTNSRRSYPSRPSRSFGKALKQTIKQIYDNRPIKFGNNHVTKSHKLHYAKANLMRRLVLVRGHSDKLKRHADVDTSSGNVEEVTSEGITAEEALQPTPPTARVVEVVENPLPWRKAFISGKVKSSIPFVEESTHLFREGLTQNQDVTPPRKTTSHETAMLSKSFEEFASSDSNNIEVGGQSEGLLVGVHRSSGPERSTSTASPRQDPSTAFERSLVRSSTTEESRLQPVFFGGMPEMTLSPLDMLDLTRVVNVNLKSSTESYKPTAHSKPKQRLLLTIKEQQRRKAEDKEVTPSEEEVVCEPLGTEFVIDRTNASFKIACNLKEDDMEDSMKLEEKMDKNYKSGADNENDAPVFGCRTDNSDEADATIDPRCLFKLVETTDSDDDDDPKTSASDQKPMEQDFLLGKERRRIHRIYVNTPQYEDEDEKFTATTTSKCLHAPVQPTEEDEDDRQQPDKIKIVRSVDEEISDDDDSYDDDGKDDIVFEYGEVTEVAVKTTEGKWDVGEGLPSRNLQLEDGMGGENVTNQTSLASTSKFTLRYTVAITLIISLS